MKAQKDGKLAICRNCNTRTYYTSVGETLAYYGKRTLERIAPQPGKDSK